MNATMTWTAGVISSPISTAATTFQLWLNVRRDGDGEDGSAGVREPRRPMTPAPTLSMTFA